MSDKINNCLTAIDQEGNLVKTVGMLGMGPLEFSVPGDIFWCESDKVLYVLDAGNKRVQKLSRDLEYIGEISISPLKIDYSPSYQSIAVDNAQNLYVSLNIHDPDRYLLYCLSPDGSLTTSDKMFGGVLMENNGDIFAVETLETFLSKEKGKESDMHCTSGNTNLYNLVSEEGQA